MNNKSKDINTLYVPLYGYVFQNCDMKLYLYLKKNMFSNTQGGWDYKYMYVKDLNKTKIAEYMGISRPTLNKYFKQLYDLGVLVLEEKYGVIKMYNLDTSEGNFCKITVEEAEILLDDKEVESDHIKTFLIYRSYSNSGKNFVGTRENIAKHIDAKGKERIVDGKTFKDFNKETLNRISDINKLLIKKGLITIKKTFDRDVKKNKLSIRCNKSNNDYTKYNNYYGINRQRKDERERKELEYEANFFNSDLF